MSNSSPQRFPLAAAGIFGVLGVALGALGAHRLQALLDEHGMAHTWETGARYHMYHAVALLAVAALVGQSGPAAGRWLRRATWCWTIGIILFAGSLYWLALIGPTPYPVVFATPVGGIALLGGWGCIGAAALAANGAAAPRA